MKKVLARFFLWLSRLTFVGEPPKESCVLVAGPHTSNWDFLFMLSYAWVTDVPLRWLGKEELFKGPMGPIMRATGGIAVDRDHPGGLVEQMAERFRDGPRMGLVITPEGTRGKRDYWKSGFYRIASEADIPIVPSFLDGPTRTGGYGPTVIPSGDLSADMDKFRAFYADKRGVKPKNKTTPRLREEDSAIA